MYYKSDWETAKQRMRAFWNNEIIDRYCIGITAPRKTSRYHSYAALTDGLNERLNAIPENDREAIYQWWVDPEQNYQRMIDWFDHTYFGGEAIPCTFVNWGAMAMACFYGSQPVFNKETVWYLPCIQDWDTWECKFDRAENIYWQQTLAIVKYYLENNAGRYFVGTPEFGSAGDLLSLMRGMDRLALDLIDYPGHCHKAIKLLGDTWIELHEQVYQMTYTANDNGGVLAWMLLWSPGRHSQLACDFASIISPSMYRNFFIPEVKQKGDWCKYGTYHLDGPAAMISTLDILLEIEQIDNIQWTPGENLAPTYSPQYIPAYKKIQAAGKRLYLLVEPYEIEPLLTHLSPKGLYLRTHVDSEDEANDLLRKAEAWSAGKNIFPVNQK